jgi:hypothetical protein
MAYGTVNADVVQSSVTGVSLGAGNATLLKNRLIDAGFIINQRGYVSGTALSTGTYAHDRWKAGASGCTYTFTQGSAGVPIVITITAGSLQQIIEGCNMPDGGTFTLSWTGTAQGRVNGGGYSTSPLIVTGLTAGANCTVEFNTGTCSFPQLEVGSSATGFEYRQYQQELALCQRYYWRWTLANQSYGYIGVGRAYSTTGGTVVVNNPVPMRASPSTNNSNNFGVSNAWDYSISAIVSNSQGTPYTQSQLGIAGTFAGDQRIFALGGGSSTTTTIWIDFSSEL